MTNGRPPTGFWGEPPDRQWYMAGQPGSEYGDALEEADTAPLPVAEPAQDRSLADVDTRPRISVAGGRREREPGTASGAHAPEGQASSAASASTAQSGRPATPAPGWRVWLARVALVIGVIALGVRAGAASLAFMSPGGDIVGWSVLPTASKPFSAVPPPTVQPQQQLTPSDYATYLTGHMTLDDELGQMIMIQWYRQGPDLTQMIANQHVGGVLLLGRPVAPDDQSLNAQLQQMAGVPLLVAIDQEGGPVNRFRDIVGSTPSASEMQTPAVAYARGQQDASLLAQYGFNLNLAPVVDVGVPNPVGQFIGRTFSNDPAQVAALAGAYTDGLQKSGQVTAVLKHFPGGVEATYTDPHLAMPVLHKSRADWESVDLAPYRTMLAKQHVRAIMVTHEMVPAVDPKLPASLSPAIIDGTLRTELGFNGVVITDDLHMDALTAQWTIAEASVLAVEAGADIVADMATPAEVKAVRDGLTQALSDGKLTRARIDASVQRILTLKIEMGLIPMPARTTVPKVPNVSGTESLGPRDARQALGDSPTLVGAPPDSLRTASLPSTAPAPAATSTPGTASTGSPAAGAVCRPPETS